MQTLRDLRETGDEITSIEGIFSGTLAYLFNVYDGSTTFSAIVRDAHQRGYTEPDPRDDLSGMDVARKLIILGREMGLALEMKDVKVESLVPSDLAQGTIEDFMGNLPRYDAAMQKRLEGARARDKVLRYVGRITAAGEATVGLAELDAQPCLRQHRADGQRGALRHAPLLRQSADRAGSGRRSRGHRRRRVRRPAAPGGLPWGAAVSGTPAATRATAFAPASVGNVAIGFDILGFSVDALGDRVTATRRAQPGVEITAVRGIAGDLPREPERQHRRPRAAGAARGPAARTSASASRSTRAFRLGSGLGGSAASAVGRGGGRQCAAAEAATQLELLKFAMAGEAVASGSLHVDNIAPSLFGGLVLTVGIDHPRVKQIPGARGHPRRDRASAHVPVHEQARAILKGSVEMSDFVWQTANLAGFISGCYTDDLDMIRASFEDVVIEPQRQALIPGFADVRRAAMAAGALGCSISGAGPTMFAWALARTRRGGAGGHARASSARHSLECDSWIVEVNSAGARVLA